MPKPIRAYNTQATEYMHELRIRGSSKGYIKDVRNHLKNAAKILDAADVMVAPHRMTKEHLAIVRDETPGSQIYKKMRTETLRRFLKHQGNYIQNFRWVRPEPNRKRIRFEDWALSIEKCWEIGDIRGATVLLLESLTIRGIGVTRMTPDDIMPTCVWTMDKGRLGGKKRKIPITPEIYIQLQQYLDWRRLEVTRILKANPRAEIPTGLIIWTRRAVMGSCTRATIEAIVKGAGRRVGVSLNSHPIRRMACQELFEAVKNSELTIQEAMAISGHENEKDFMIYVGSIEAGSRKLIQTVMDTRKERIRAIKLLSR